MNYISRFFAMLNANCPTCGRAFAFLNKLVPFPHCIECDRYCMLTSKDLSPVAQGTIALSPTFAIRLDRLCPPSKWTWPEPGLCNACSAPAARKMTLEIAVASEGLFAISVPCCERCGIGVRLQVAEANLFEAMAAEMASSGPRKESEALYFVSYDRYLAFKRLNGAQRPRPSN